MMPEQIITSAVESADAIFIVALQLGLMISSIIASGYCFMTRPAALTLTYWRGMLTPISLLHIAWGFFFLVAYGVLAVLMKEGWPSPSLIYFITIPSLIGIPLWFSYLAGIKKGLDRQARLPLGKNFSEFFKRDMRNENHLFRVIQVCEASSKNIFKRIDENRELLEFLQKESPELLKRCSWIEGWIAGNDHFFNDLVHALGSENIFADLERMHPRPWPGHQPENRQGL